MPFEKRVVLPGSENVQRPGLQAEGKVPGEEQIYIHVVLREPRQASVDLVEEWAHEVELTVVEASVSRRRVTLTGTAQQLEGVLHTELVHYRAAGTDQRYRGRKGTISIPSELEGTVTAILGLDARPVARPHFRPLAAAPNSFTPLQVAQAYNFPSNLTGKGQTIAIIELGGGYRTADLTAYFKNLNLKTPKVTAVSVDGAHNAPGSEADGEVLLDIEVAGAIANAAQIAVYFAPNTDAGFVNAITNAAHDTTRKPSVISISWGGSEDSWSQQARNAMNAALQDAAAQGITVTVASGDQGSTDGVGDGKLHVDYPASSPYALACGGTTLRANGSTITAESVWNQTASGNGATGGGVSAVNPLPDYQKSAGVPKQGQTSFVGRGVPDVAGNADPTTGYRVRVNGQDVVVGGTSAVAPLWAALIAKINSQGGKRVGFINPTIYGASAPSAFHDITSGNNDDAKTGFYKAKAGWDPCTGLGSPNGTALLQLLSSSPSRHAEVPGSQLQHQENSVWTDATPDTGAITATIILNRSGDDAGDQALGSAEPALHHGNASSPTAASEKTIREVRAFAASHGLHVIAANATTRTVQVEGTPEQMASAFGVQLGYVGQGAQRYFTYRGAVHVPDALQGKVMAVLGLDQRPIARHHISTANA